MSIVEDVKTLREIRGRKTKVEGKTFENETVYIDFKIWENCMFENCRLVAEYGFFAITGCSLTKCHFEVVPGSPAEAIRLFFDMVDKKGEKVN